MKRLMIGVLAGAASMIAWQKPSARADEPLRLDQNAASGQGQFDHSLWNTVLSKNVDDRGRVDYSGVRDSSLFRDYLAKLKDTSADALIDHQDRLAFWINAYNALTIQAVLQTLPTDPATWSAYRITEQKVRGMTLWKGIQFDVGGGRWTLDGIEHEILRKKDGLRDPRIHVALVCAARGCPPLWNKAFTGRDVKEQLAAAMRRFVSNSEQCRIDAERRVIRISKVFEWYGGDFVDAQFIPYAVSIPKFLAEYVTDDTTSMALRTGSWKVSYFDYDWKLNIQR